jgi:3-oxoacyl-[acyl-carrier protein] reductase
MVNVLITGASKGIGKAIVEQIAPFCKGIVLVARTKVLLEELGEKINDLNSNCRVIIQDIDISNEENVKNCLQKTSETIGYIDILINCAGKAIFPKGIQEISLDEWNEVFTINVTATYLFVKYSLPLLKLSKSPKIINIASTAGTNPRPGWSVYAASKASVINFTKTIAEEFKPYGISVFCIAPGRTATDLRKTLAPNEDPNSIMQPEEVAKFVKFLMSDTGKYLAGDTIIFRGN